MKECRVIIAGGRDFNDYFLLKDSVRAIISKYDSPVKIISGTCRGADRMGEKFAYDTGIEVERFPANWNDLGKRAGFVRNAEMAKYACEDNNVGILIAFWDGKSKGTKHMIEIARKNGLSVYVINY